MAAGARGVATAVLDMRVVSGEAFDPVYGLRSGVGYPLPPTLVLKYSIDWG
jgi:hypothetical protein